MITNMKKIINNIILLILLFLGDIFINEKDYYFLLIYICLILYHLYFFYLLIHNKRIIYFDCRNFLFTSIILYLFTYFIIYDPNPFFSIITFYSFYPNFIKAIFIIAIHTYYISYYLKNCQILSINLQTAEESSSNESQLNKKLKYISESYFLSAFFINSSNKQKFRHYFIGLILVFIAQIIIFLNRIRIWVYLNDKEKTIPNSALKNTTFYITSNLVNIGSIIDNYIEQLKYLIDYLGEKNVIISIVENEDSIDNTRNILSNFQNYLTEKNILNKFYLKREIEDPRKLNKPFVKYSRLRIEYFAKLRNKCLEFLYEIPNIDFNNTIALFLNDIVFKFEDIINLLSTNNEDFDVACALDMNDKTFYDRWVSIDLEGDGMRKYFPFFINKEAQDLVVNHKPIRVFSCWNGAIAFRASSLKDKNIQFRNKINYTQPFHNLNNPHTDYYESECTYFNIDLFSAGYTKKFINPDVRVTYKHQYFFQSKYFIPSLKNIIGYFILYFVSLTKKRNKYMSNYKIHEIRLNSIINNWYLENKK